MNKNKMGKYLRQLRKEKKISLETLSREFEKEYLSVGINAISSWENGKTIPNINNLTFLANFYGVTIDEILDGEKYNKIDFETIYFLHKPISEIAKLLEKCVLLKDVHLECSKQAVFIRKRCKTLIFKYINKLNSKQETDELTFLIENYFDINPDLSIRTFLQKISDYKNLCLTKDDVWWIIQRDLQPSEMLRVSFANISDERYKLDSVSTRYAYLEDWEKDMLLAMIQRGDPICYDPTKYTSKSIVKYRQDNKKDFDSEQITKDTIRFLIENGAKINTSYLGYYKLITEEVRPIDHYEYLYDCFEKPISFHVIAENKIKKYFVENNYKNHVLVLYRYSIVKPLLELGYSYDEIIKLIIDNEEIPDEIYLRAAKNKGLNLNRDFSLIKADVHLDYLYLQQEWGKCREEYLGYPDKCVDSRLDSKRIRDNVLSENGKTEIMNLVWVGGEEPNEVEEYIKTINQSLTYSEFKRNRKDGKTKELLECLDKYTMEEIKELFFEVGGKEHD